MSDPEMETGTFNAAYRHNDPGCDGEFSVVRNPSNRPFEGDGPDALVCGECGAWRPVGDMDEDLNEYLP